MTETQKEKLKAKIDVAQVFLVFMSLVGDVGKTAAALDLEPSFVEWLADKEGWQKKIKRINLMSKGEKPGDFERAVNRAMIFVQAHQMRGVVDRILGAVRTLSTEDLMSRCSSVDKFGNLHYSAKFFLDLSSAMETCSRVALVALGDTVTERVERNEEASGGLPVSALHQAIIAALDSPVLGQTSDSLVREQAASLTKAIDVKSHCIPVSGLDVTPSQDPDVGA